MKDKKHDQKNIPDEQMMKEQEKKILKNRSNNRKNCDLVCDHSVDYNFARDIAHRISATE